MPSDDFNDDFLDTTQWRIVNSLPTDPYTAKIEERNGRLEVYMPPDCPANYLWGVKTLPKRIDDIDVRIDFALGENVRLATFLIGRDNPEPANPAVWYYPHYRILYSGTYHGGYLIIRRADENGVGTSLYEGAIGYQPYLQLRMKVLNNTISFYINNVEYASDDCSWMLSSLGNMGIIEFTTQTENIEALCVFDNYIEKLASTPDPTLHSLEVIMPVNGVVTPWIGTWIYPDQWHVSLYGVAEAMASLQKWILDGLDIPADNPVIINMDTSHTIEPIFYMPPIATIQGVVSDSTTQQPIEGAKVECDGLSTVYTDVYGYYSFENIDAGAYTITVSKPYYVTQSLYVDVSGGGLFTLDLELIPVLLATIQGFVSDIDTGNPIAGALVSCNGFQDITEVDGIYQFAGIEAKQYALTVTTLGYEEGTAIVDASGGGAFSVDFALTQIQVPTATIEGVVSSVETGQPIAGATVKCDGIIDITEVDGSYRFQEVEAKQYVLTVSVLGYQSQSTTIDASLGGIFTQNFTLETGVPPCPADAAYMPNILHPDLRAIRKFRDRCVPSTLKKTYYRYSPLLTPLIINSEKRKRLVKKLIKLFLKMFRRGTTNVALAHGRKTY